MLDHIISSYPQNKYSLLSFLRLVPLQPLKSNCRSQQTPTLIIPTNPIQTSAQLKQSESESDRESRMQTLTSTSSFLNPPTLSTPSKSRSPSSIFSISPTRIPSQRKTTTVSRNVALKQDSTTATSTSSSSQESEEPSAPRIGAKVKVKVPLKVYHVPKVPEIDLFDKEGTIKQHIGLWKGKRISANLPFKVEFLAKVEGRDQPVKFVAHLKEDEFDYLD